MNSNLYAYSAGYFDNNRRYAGVDLNRIFPGVANGNCSQQYAYRFLHRIVAQFEYLVDLHTASRGRINSLYVRADMQDHVIARMATLQHPQIILHNPKSAADGTLRSAAMALGIKAITVEIGNPLIFQKRYIRHALAGVTQIMSYLKMIPDQKEEAPPHPPTICTKSYWIYTDIGGVLFTLPEVSFIPLKRLIIR